MLTIEDKKYIDGAINKSQKDTERYLGILSEKHTGDLKLIKELLVTRPTKEEVDEKIQGHVSIYHTIS